MIVKGGATRRNRPPLPQARSVYEHSRVDIEPHPAHVVADSFIDRHSAIYDALESVGTELVRLTLPHVTVTSNG